MAVNTATFGCDHEHRKVSLSPANSEIVKNVNLVYYAPGVIMPAHSHGTAQLSTLLCGQSVEQIASSTVENHHGVAEFKPMDCYHANTIGTEGALLLSINLDDKSEGFTAEFGKVGWHLSDITQADATWRFLRDVMFRPKENTTVDLEEVILGLLSGARPYQGKVKTAPNWLKLAVQALHDDTLSIGAIASNIGVHRVHLSRVFQAHFGISVSHYRQKILLQRSLSALFHHNQNLVQSSCDSGFSDQSHFTRVLKQHFSVTPSRLVSLFSQ